MIVSITVCVSHAHASIDTESEHSMSIDADSSEDTSLGSNNCDMSCGGCCVHHAVETSHNANIVSVDDKNLLIPDTSIFVSDFIYGLKRPPKS